MSTTGPGNGNRNRSRNGATSVAPIDLLVASDLRFAYDTEAVVDGVSLRVGAGEFVALVGPNGSGKSTLLRLLLGLLEPLSGSVELFGSRPSQLRDRWRLGYVSQRPSLAEGLTATVEEVVASGRLARRGWFRPSGQADRVEVSHALESVALTEHRHDPISSLSGGQQQRAFIARALVTQPELLILDEPVAGVDAASQHQFAQSLTHMVRSHGAAVLLVSHELGAVADALDRVIVLKRTVRFDGPPSALTSSGVSLGVNREDLPLWLEGL